MLLIAITVATVTLCVLVHELGHFLVARALGLQVNLVDLGIGPVLACWTSRGPNGAAWKVRLLPLCGRVEFDSPPASLARVAVFLAGPAANLLLAGLLSLFMPTTVAQGVLARQPADFGHAVQRLSTWYGLFNLLPHAGLDGGQILLALIRRSKRKGSAVPVKPTNPEQAPAPNTRRQ